MKATYLIVLFFLSRNLAGQWIQIEDNSPDDPCFWAIQFPAPDTGFVIGHSLIGKTVDGGDTWTYTEIDGSSFSKVDFINVDTGIVCCGVGGGENFTITYDGGETWEFPTQFFIVGQDLEFLENGTIFLLENYPPLVILHQFGNFYEEYLGAADWMGYGIDIDFPTIDTGFINGYLDDFVDPSQVMLSVDGGNSWSGSLLGAIGPVDELNFPSARVGYGRGDDTRRIWKSIDYGNTWEIMPWEFGGALEGWQSDIAKIYFFNDTVGYVGIHTIPEFGINHYEVFRTMNGGVSWDSTNFSEDETGITDIFCTDPLTCYLTTCLNGIYKTTNGGGNLDTTIIIDNLMDIKLENEFNLYPNPANDKIVIELNSHFIQNSKVFLSISDLSGKIISQQLVKSDQTQIDILDYTAGFYFVKVIIDGNQFVQKLIIE